MRSIVTYLFVSFISIGLSSPTIAQKKISSEEYIKLYKGMAVSQMEKYGVPASIILGQGLLESGSGNSTLAVKANNHFGIKCHKTWTGPRIYHDDDAKGECFRKYRTPEKSFQDHSEFLRGARRYAFLFDLDPTDYKGWAYGLKQAGYATDPQYPKKLIRIIEEYKLFALDSGIEISIQSPTKGMGEEIDPENFSIDIFKQRKLFMKNRIKYIVVQKGDTYEDLTRDLELMPWQLAKYNEIERGSKLEVGQELFIQPKRRKAEVNHPLHIAEEGETMYDIAQMYGVRLKWLYRRNRVEQGIEPVAGEKVYLRGTKPKNE
ncbi:MAG: glucosaminidase domain-containing protein [Bacteroidales bacterium]|nr:glucosaminidase domain-containing protein [Bacteroidales bacterium]MDD4384276.1 glucosaminidase domain-containing protein [Bacteroidales bacterium]MDY0198579.1 glucosaminidase domain-containing protein [Tenuifilaceae bacterium]